MATTLGIIAAATQLGFSEIRVKPKRAIGPFSSQVTIEESHSDDLEITEHPVDQGARISDHAFKRPAEVTIKCGWSNSPAAASFLGNLAGAASGTVSGVNSLLSGSDVEQIRAIYDELIKFQESRVPFTVFTGKRTYTNMLIKSLQTITDKEHENVLSITAVLRQVLIANTQTVTFSAPQSAQKQPGVTNPVTNMGGKSLVPGTSYNSAAGNAAMNPAPRGDL